MARSGFSYAQTPLQVDIQDHIMKRYTEKSRSDLSSTLKAEMRTTETDLRSDQLDAVIKYKALIVARQDKAQVAYL